MSSSNFKDLTGVQFGKLKEWTVIGFAGINSRGKAEWLCENGSGDTKKYESSTINQKKNYKYVLKHKHGKLVSKLDNKKIGKLTVKEISHRDKHRNVYWKCICECGRENLVSSANLNSKSVTSCGKCGIFRNSIPTSKAAITLHSMLNRGVHNFKTRIGYYIDIAFVYNNSKIAIEYDEWYWHKNTIDKDNTRRELLIKDGWKVVSIKARKNLPSVIDIENALLKLNNQNIVEIILPGWVEGSQNAKL